MAKKLDEFIGSLPKEKQIATEQGFQKLDAEYIAFYTRASCSGT